MKKIITTFGMIIIVLVALSIEAFAGASGTCGDNLSWSVDASGNLKIKGEGAMWDYNVTSPAPWQESREYFEIKNVRIDSGVTSIGEC